MLKSGNSNPSVCVDNLLKMREMECPMDRMRGLRSDLIDTAADIEDVESDILDTIGTYEKRISVDDISADISAEGDAEIELSLSEDYSDDDEDNERREESVLDSMNEDGGDDNG